MPIDVTFLEQGRQSPAEIAALRYCEYIRRLAQRYRQPS
jgi:hypothetical protein